MKYDIGQSVILPGGYRGYRCATGVDYEFGPAVRYIIEFSSGLRLYVYEDQLEEASHV